MSENEQFYDEEIAPKLAELARACGERGMSFAAYVEDSVASDDEDGYFSGATIKVEDGFTAAFFIVWHAILANADVDRVMLDIAPLGSLKIRQDYD